MEVEEKSVLKVGRAPTFANVNTFWEVGDCVCMCECLCELGKCACVCVFYLLACWCLKAWHPLVYSRTQYTTTLTLIFTPPPTLLSLPNSISTMYTCTHIRSHFSNIGNIAKGRQPKHVHSPRHHTLPTE